MIEVLELDPPPGSKIDRDSVIRARLRYELPEGFQGHYFVLSQFKNSSLGGGTFDGAIPSSEYPVLTEPAGTVSYSYPMRWVADSPELARPIAMWYFLNIRTAKGRSSVVARTGPFRYQTR